MSETGKSALRKMLQEPANQKLMILTGFFLLAFFIPFDAPRVASGVQEAFLMLSEYAREHVLLCLVPAFFIAGGVMVFLSKESIIQYFGPAAPKYLAYSVASVSGAILAVCSCTVLPLFKSIYKKGAGIGPAIAFLYSGPAINVLAVVLTARVLGLELGIARAAGAILFAFLTGLCMHLIYRKEDAARQTDTALFAGIAQQRPLSHTGIHMLSMIGILVFINWAPSAESSALWDTVYRGRYLISGIFGLILVYSIIRWFTTTELKNWVRATKNFAIQIMPMLFGGVLVAGFLLGRPGEQALIPAEWVAGLVGGNSLAANFFASISGALMYFATLTEVPIMQSLLGSGMGQGPALALLLAGPTLSLPSILVIAGELGWKKTLVFVGLVVGMSTAAGLIYGSIMGS